MVARPEKPARPRFTGVITAEESASLAPRAPGVIKAVAGGISPAQNVEEQRMNVKRAEAAVERARSTHAAELARAQTARDHFADTELRAPFSGTVALRFHDAGNRVQAGEPIIKLVGQGRMRLRFAIAPEDARTIAPDATVTATVDTIASPLTATVKQVAPAVDPATGMIIVDAELAADDHAAELRPGLAAWVTLP
jgi:multidrug resistance efflux pump